MTLCDVGELLHAMVQRSTITTFVGGSSRTSSKRAGQDWVISGLLASDGAPAADDTTARRRASESTRRIVPEACDSWLGLLVELLKRPAVLRTQDWKKLPDALQEHLHILAVRFRKPRTTCLVLLKTLTKAMCLARGFWDPGYSEGPGTPRRT